MTTQTLAPAHYYVALFICLDKRLIKLFFNYNERENLINVIGLVGLSLIKPNKIIFLKYIDKNISNSNSRAFPINIFLNCHSTYI